MQVLYSYSGGHHGFAVERDGITYPQAKTQVGAKRKASQWINLGLNRKDLLSAFGCGWSIDFVKKKYGIKNGKSSTTNQPHRAANPAT